MKRTTIFLLSFGLLFGCTGVASADVGAKKVPKTESTFDLQKYEPSTVVVYSFEDAATQVEFHITVITSGLSFQAVMPDPIFVPKGNVSFISLKEPLYHDPDIDRKWVWWYSVVTNS